MEASVAAARPGESRISGIDISVVAAICAAWIAFFAFGGTIGSDYHLLDDHEILRIVADLRTHSFLEALPRWLGEDLALRFRPFYFVHRLAEAALFRDDLRLWALYTAVLAPATSTLLYLALRSLRFAPLPALAFAFFGMCGEQAAIWWRLGPNETIGMVCLAVGLLGLARWTLTDAPAWRAAFWAGTILASLSKESFVALLPALALAAVWAVAWQRRATWRGSAAACAPDLVVLAVVFTIEALVIVLVVGTEKIGYAGARGVTPAQVWTAATRLLGWQEAATLGGLAALAAVSRALGQWRLPATWRDCVALAAPGLVLSVVVIGGQAFLYAKSGLFERYRAPGALVFAFLAAILLRPAASSCRDPGGAGVPHLPPRAGLRWANGRHVLPALSAAILLPLALARVVSMDKGAATFAADGRETQRFLDELAGLPPGVELLVAGGLGGVAEQFWSIRWYLRVRLARERVRFFFVEPDAPLSPFERQLVDSFERSEFFPKVRVGEDTRPAGAVAVLRGEDRPFLRRARWFDPRAYTRQALPGSFVLYTLRRP